MNTIYDYEQCMYITYYNKMMIGYSYHHNYVSLVQDAKLASMLKFGFCNPPFNFFLFFFQYVIPFPLGVPHFLEKSSKDPILEIAKNVTILCITTAHHDMITQHHSI